MQYSVNVDPLMHSQIYQEPQLSSPLWSTAAPNDHAPTQQSGNGPMLLLMPPLPVHSLSPSPLSPMSPSPLSPTFSPSPLSPMSGDFYPGSPVRCMRNRCADESPDVTSPVTNSRSSKGPISKLQEFVQSSKTHPLPSSCAVLQWSHENRMAGSSLQFRATTSFLLDGVPHHVLGGWWPSKKQSQRDAAERALAFFIGMCGQELSKGQQGNSGYKSRGQNDAKHEEDPEVMDLQDFVGQQLQWSCRWEVQEEQTHDYGALCKATVEFTYLGIPHVFAGKACTGKSLAKADTARRVLWYLHAPGYENAFEVEQEHVKVLAQAIPEPVPGTWPPSVEAMGSPSTVASTCEQEMDLSPCSPTSPGHKSQAEADLLERKTTVMRLQNRLQKIFAKQLTPGKSVWCWRYEKNESDHTFQASVHISLLDRSFTGGWAATHQAAQMEACNQLAAFLDKDFKA
ncbi:Ubiquitin thioesterase OTU1 [Durusdinium trenchii]